MGNVWSVTRRSPLPKRSVSDHRIPFEHDYDRLLFSTPVRRLADKTQVFPLDRNDAVRTRLTHSHEVANLARSMGVRLISEGIKIDSVPDPRAVPAILSAIGLAHDLGNPPFGHQGEAAIGNWFKLRGEGIFKASRSWTGANRPIPKRLWPEFLQFEGNAQTFRIVSRLQVAVGGYGLDLTAGTLAALLKYPTSCDKRNKEIASTKKYGFFESEHKIVQWVRNETGLAEGQRHPVTWIMEAADDIAYS
ncbi:MAG: dGTP triphosphohydrolase, partial [Burkholderiales bacterium]